LAKLTVTLSRWKAIEGGSARDKGFTSQGRVLGKNIPNSTKEYNEKSIA